MGIGSKVKNSKRIFSQDGSYEAFNSRISNLENNVSKVTYYEIISGTSGSLTIPTGATINEGEFGLSGNAILSQINVSDKPTYESPLNGSGSAVTASLDLSGNWITSGVYVEPQVALIYSLNISGLDYHNLDPFYIISEVKLNASGSTGTQNLQEVTDNGSTTTNAIDTAGITTDYVQLDTTITPSNAVGKIEWNDTDGTANLGLKGGNVVLQIGQEHVVRVVNKSGVNLLEANYQVVKIVGATGQRLSVSLAQADSDANSASTLALVTENINNNQEGFCTVLGQVHEINTTGSLQGETWADGDILYLSGTTAGAITNVKPSAPIHTITIGYVEYAHAIHGKIYVKIDNGYELEELHDMQDVSYSTPVDADSLLIKDNSTSLWKRLTIANLKTFLTGLYVGLTGNQTVAGQKTFTDNTNIGNASGTNQRQLRVGQGTAISDLGSLVGTSTAFAMYTNQAIPSSTNYTLMDDGSSIYLNGKAANSLYFQIGATNVHRIGTNFQLLTPTAAASGSVIKWQLTVPADTGLTASTNTPNFKILGNSKQFATGALATQYFNYFSGNTLAFVGASTATDVFNAFFEITTAGTNATITNNYALGTNGNVKFDDGTSKFIWRAVPTIPSYSGVFLNVTPNSSNYAMANDGSGNTFVNGTANVYVSANATNVSRWGSLFQLHTPVAASSGSIIKWQLTIPADTGMTASTNIPNFKILGNTKQFATGALTTQYFNYITANTLAFVGASTATDVFALYVEKTIAGTNATITNNYAAGFGGNVRVVGNINASGIYIGDTLTITPTARLHLAAGEAGAGKAPLKLTSGTNLSSVEDGAIEYNGTDLFFTAGSTRNKIMMNPYASKTLFVQGILPNSYQSIPNGADTVIEFADQYDPQGWYNASTFQFTPTVAGYYNISLGVWFSAFIDPNQQFNAQARINGNTFMILQDQTSNTSAGAILFGTKIQYFNGTTDYADFTAYQSADPSNDIQKGSSAGSGTWFSAIRLDT